MNFYYRSLRLLGLSVAAICMFVFTSNGQVQTPRSIAINALCKGFYEYLPQGYDGSAKFPLLIFLHGVSEAGKGTTSDLSKLLANGLPKMINDNTFPKTFTVNGSTYSFIVISPQFDGWPTPQDVDAVIEYAKKTYQVDANRIYVTGLSMGGGGTWDFAGNNAVYPRKIAAIVPICGASSAEGIRSRNIAGGALPVWATHNDGDPQVPVAFTNDYVAQINAEYFRLNPTATQPLAKKTIFTSDKHDAWSETYKLSFKENGLNVFEWMLQFSRNTAESPLPVVLTRFDASLNSGNTLLSWATSMEQNNSYFTIEYSTDGAHFTEKAKIIATNNSTGSTYSYTDKQTTEGVNYYRLSQTDKDGKHIFFKTVTVNVDASKKEEFTINPNPIINQVEVALNNGEKGALKIAVLSGDGKLIETRSYNKSGTYWKTTFSVDHLKPGYYLMKVTVGSTTFIKKVIKK